MKPLKRIGKSFLANRLEKSVLRLREHNKLTVIAVAGSVGKTSTKLAIAELLSACGAKVQFQNGNYNDRLTIPLIFFGETEPGLFNVIAWLRLLSRVKKASQQSYPYTYVVVELGTDAPGQMAEFAYLHPEIGVLTAIAAEHMEHFKTISAVGTEESQIVSFSQQLLINIDDVDKAYLPAKQYQSYSFKQLADYRIKIVSDDQLSVQIKNHAAQQFTSAYLGQQGAKTVLAACAVANICGFESQLIIDKATKLRPAPGRLQTLVGKQRSTVLDDTYNASPIAVSAALEVLFARPEAHKIAILGSMNELGNDSQAAHQAIGALCSQNKPDLLVTIGQQANDYLASAAEANGCSVQHCSSPVEAGQIVVKLLTKDTVVLVKGSQNGVFAEEAVKQLLANSADRAQLVRQSKAWMSIKQGQFSDIAT